MLDRLLKPRFSEIIDWETFELEKQKWEAEMKIRKAELEERRAKVEERDRKREAERELPSRRSSDNKFIPRMRCFACGATTHIEINCPQLLCKTTPKSETNVSRVGVGILRNDPALKD